MSAARFVRIGDPPPQDVTLTFTTPSGSVQSAICFRGLWLPLYTDQELEFAKRVRDHELTFQFSEDPEHWCRGAAQLRAIRIVARRVDPRRAVDIWNWFVDRKLPSAVDRLAYHRELGPEWTPSHL